MSSLQTTPTRRTRILATIGPASDSPEILEKLFNAGLNGCRLNFSHGSHDEHKKRIETIRTLEKKLGRSITIIQDLCGPKVRTDNNTYNIKVGEKWLLYPAPANAPAANGVSAEKKIGVQHPNLHTRLKVGDTVLLDDGKLEMRVEKSTPEGVLCEIIVGGELKPKKSVNTPGVDNGLDVLSEKDRADLAFGKENSVNWVAISFVRHAEDVRRVREYTKGLNWSVPLISKIETPLAIQNLEEIVQESDGIMVARGDLGIECPIEEVPILQKRCLELAKNYSKLSIVATQMLESMTSSPRPTRAEASDVSNAVFEGTQVVMLSGETASGNYPLETVQIMHKICSIAESASGIGHLKPQSNDQSQKLFGGALKIGDLTDSPCIVVTCRTAEIARYAASFHGHTPILAIFNEPDEAQTAAIFYGVVPLLIPATNSSGGKVSLYDLERLVRDTIFKLNFAKIGDQIPLVFAQPRTAEHLNTIRVVKI